MIDVNDTDFECTVVECERALIGQALCAGYEVRDMMDALPIAPCNFAVPHHAGIWSAIRLLALRGQPVTSETVAAELSQVGIGEQVPFETLEAMGYSAALLLAMSRTDSVIPPARTNAALILEVALRRELLAVTNAARELAQGDGTGTEIADAIGSLVLQAIARVQPLRDSIKYLDEAQAADGEAP